MVGRLTKYLVSFSPKLKAPLRRRTFLYIATNEIQKHLPSVKPTRVYCIVYALSN